MHRHKPIAVELSEGSIVTFSSSMDERWILHKGWYEYENDLSFGWYIVSIPDQQLRPLLPEDYTSLILLSESDRSCNKYPQGCQSCSGKPDVPNLICSRLFQQLQNELKQPITRDKLADGVIDESKLSRDLEKKLRVAEDEEVHEMFKEIFGESEKD